MEKKHFIFIIGALKYRSSLSSKMLHRVSKKIIRPYVTLLNIFSEIAPYRSHHIGKFRNSLIFLQTGRSVGHNLLFIISVNCHDLSFSHPRNWFQDTIVKWHSKRKRKKIPLQFLYWECRILTHQDSVWWEAKGKSCKTSPFNYFRNVSGYNTYMNRFTY